MTVSSYWIFSILAPCCLALSNLIDNHVLHSRLSDPVSYDVLTTWPTVPVAAAIFLVTRVSFATEAWTVGLSIGFVFSFLIILYNYAMMKEQGANVVSVIYTSPMFVAAIAFLFLGERLSAINYSGVLLLVASAFLVLYRRISSSNPALGVLLVYALCSATARVATKSALEGVDVWSYFFWFLMGGIIGSTVLALARRRRLGVVVRHLDVSVTTMICLTAFFSTLGLVLLYSAFSLGSVTLTSGLSAIQPSLVLAFSTVLLRFRSNAIPTERLAGRWIGLRKALAALLIIAGVLALAGT